MLVECLDHDSIGYPADILIIVRHLIHRYGDHHVEPILMERFDQRKQPCRIYVPVCGQQILYLYGYACHRAVLDIVFQIVYETESLSLYPKYVGEVHHSQDRMDVGESGDGHDIVLAEYLEGIPVDIFPRDTLSRYQAQPVRENHIQLFCIGPHCLFVDRAVSEEIRCRQKRFRRDLRKMRYREDTLVYDILVRILLWDVF